MDELLFDSGCGGTGGGTVIAWLVLAVDDLSFTTEEVLEGAGDGTRSIDGTDGGMYAGTSVCFGAEDFFDGVGEDFELVPSESVGPDFKVVKVVVGVVDVELLGVSTMVMFISGTFTPALSRTPVHSFSKTASSSWP